MAAVLAAAVVVLGGTQAVAAPAEVEAGDEVVAIEAPIVIEPVDADVDITDPDLVAEVEAVHDSFEPGNEVPAGAEAYGELLTASSGSTMTATFSGGTPAGVQTVVYAALNQWESALSLNPSGPVEVAVNWAPLSGGVLGSAGPDGLFTDPGLPTGDFYPAPLVNTLLGTDFNDTYYGSARPEVLITLNSSASWYIGTSGSPGAGQADLYSVVLHEIAHGLGFLGSGTSLDGSTTVAPYLKSPPFIYDRLDTFGGIPLLSDGSPSSRLTSNSLRILLSDSYDSAVYAPLSWQEGSSFSHFDESAVPPGSAGALMTPVLNGSTTERSLDAAVLGVMAGIGWPMTATPVAPTLMTAEASGSSLRTAWGFDLRQHGTTPDQVRMEAYQGSTLIGSSTVPASAGGAAITGTGCGSYTVRLVPLRGSTIGTWVDGAVSVSVPTAPAGVLVSGSGLTRTISWGASTSCSGVPTYAVERSTDGINWTPVGSTGLLSISATVPAGVHQFRVRALNGGGASAWAQTIPVGISADLVRPVPLDGQLSRLYQAYFLRPADGAGFSYWLDKRSTRASLADVSSEFAASPEFQARYGSLDNNNFVHLVYWNVMGRSPDLDGYNFWMAQLAAGMSRGTMMTGFSESAEFVNRTGTSAVQTATEGEVYRLYVAAFVRFPDSAGQGHWIGVRSGGARLESIAASFVASAEFAQTYGSLNNEQFVRRIYLNVLGREPDLGGYTYWVTALAGGVSRSAMLVGFSESAEFVQATGTVR